MRGAKREIPRSLWRLLALVVCIAPPFACGRSVPQSKKELKADGEGSEHWHGGKHWHGLPNEHDDILLYVFLILAILLAGMLWLHFTLEAAFRDEPPPKKTK